MSWSCHFRFFIIAGFGEGTPQQDSIGTKFGPMVDSCSKNPGFSALPKKSIELLPHRCYNYFGYLYASFALTYIRLILSMKARNDYEV